MESKAERRLMFSHLGGKATGLEEASGYVLQRASVLFSLNKDDRAIALREVAVHLRAMTDAVRIEQAKYKD